MLIPVLILKINVWNGLQIEVIHRQIAEAANQKVGLNHDLKIQKVPHQSMPILIPRVQHRKRLKEPTKYVDRRIVGIKTKSKHLHIVIVVVVIEIVINLNPNDLNHDLQRLHVHDDEAVEVRNVPIVMIVMTVQIVTKQEVVAPLGVIHVHEVLNDLVVHDHALVLNHDHILDHRADHVHHDVVLYLVLGPIHVLDPVPVHDPVVVDQEAVVEIVTVVIAVIAEENGNELVDVPVIQEVVDHDVEIRVIREHRGLAVDLEVHGEVPNLPNHDRIQGNDPILYLQEDHDLNHHRECIRSVQVLQ